MRFCYTAPLVFLAALTGCVSDLNLYNPDGSINHRTQADMTHRNYTKMMALFDEQEMSEGVQYMIKVQSLVSVFPEIEGQEKWNESRKDALDYFDKMQAAFRIGHFIEGKRFGRKAGMGINTIWMLSPTLFDEKGNLKSEFKIMEKSAGPEINTPLDAPTRPPGLYDN